MVKDIELLDKRGLADYLKVSIPTINKMLERKEIPGVIRLSDKLIRFRKDRIDEWLESLPSERTSKEQYTKKTLKIPGKKGNYSWAGTLRKIEKLAKKRKINLASEIYPLFLLEEVLGIDNEAFITLLENLALKRVIELIEISPSDIKKRMKVYELPGVSKDKKYYGFIYRG